MAMGERIKRRCELKLDRPAKTLSADLVSVSTA